MQRVKVNQVVGCLHSQRGLSSMVRCMEFYNFVVADCRKTYEAASTNNVDYFKEVLEGAHTEMLDRYLEIALLRAANVGHKECVAVLLDGNVSVSTKGEFNDTALILAAKRGQTEVAELLIEYGCPVNYQNSRGYTALMAACEFGNLEVAELLLRNGSHHSGKLTENSEHSNIRLEDCLGRFTPYGCTPLMVTVLHRPLDYKELMKLLLKVPVDVNEKDSEDCTVLHQAAKQWDSTALKLLLDANAQVNCIDISGLTPLMNACSNNMVDNVRILLQYGADVSIINKDRRSCLSIAARTACAEIISMLLIAGADPNHLDSHKKSPLFIAMCRPNYEIMKCFIQNGCDMNISCFEVKSWQTLTYFAYAIWRKDVQMIQMLYKAGACSNQSLYQFLGNQKFEVRCNDTPKVFEALHELASRPRSLLSCCRLAIRNLITTSLPVCVRSLALPKSLKDYLLYSDISTDHSVLNSIDQYEF